MVKKKKSKKDKKQPVVVERSPHQIEEVSVEQINEALDHLDQLNMNAHQVLAQLIKELNIAFTGIKDNIDSHAGLLQSQTEATLKIFEILGVDISTPVKEETHVTEE